MPRALKDFYWIALHLLLVLVLWKSDFLHKVGYRIGWITAWPHHERMLTYHLWMDPLVPEGSVIFIGDSLIQGLPVSAVVPNGINYGIGGDTTATVLKRIKAYGSLERAGALVLLVGVNDLRWRSNETILVDYEAILEQLPPDRAVYLLSILPVRPEAGAIAIDANARIRELNEALQTMAQDRLQVTYVDVHSILSDEEGALGPTFDFGDGLHLSPTGYRALIKAVQSSLQIAKRDGRS